MATMDEVLSAIDAGQARRSNGCSSCSRIPSVSAVPAHFPDCDRAADWLVAELAVARLRGRQASDRRAADGARPSQVRPAGRAACAVLRPLRRAARRSPRSSGRSPPFEPKLESGPRGERIVGARRARRQGPAHDLPRGLPGLPESAACPARSPRCSRARRRPARPPCPPSWRRTPRRSRRTSRSCATPGCGTRRRPRSPSCSAAIVGRGGRPHRPRPRPALRHVRRPRGQSDQRARPASSASCTTSNGAVTAARASTTGWRSFPRSSSSYGTASISTPPRSWTGSA